jgi:uncharacterized membrane protein
MKKNLLPKNAMSKKLTLIIITLIILGGAILRFYNLGQVPHGFHRDEAFLGYNAYSHFRN